MAVFNPGALTDLNRLSDYMSLSSTFPADDENLLITLTNALSGWVASVTRRDNLKYRVRTIELHDGRTDDIITSRHRPIISVEAVYDSGVHTWDASSLLAVADYFTENAGAGVIRRFNGRFSNGKRNVRLDYTSGYTEFIIQAGQNDQLVVTDDDGAFTITMTEAAYTAASLATELNTQLTAGATNATYTVAYSQVADRFSIVATGTVALSVDFLTSVSTRMTEFGKLLGYSVAADKTGALTYRADYPALGVPEELIHAVTEVVLERYEPIKERRLGKSSQATENTSMTFTYGNLPETFIDYIMGFRDIVIADVY